MTAFSNGRIAKISGNMVTVIFDSLVMQNEVAYICHGQERLKSEVIRVRGNLAEIQVYESTGGLKIGEEVEFTGELLSVELGPGMLGQIFDGLQNPLPEIVSQCGFFLQRGIYLKGLSDSETWNFTPMVSTFLDPVDRYLCVFGKPSLFVLFSPSRIVTGSDKLTDGAACAPCQMKRLVGPEFEMQRKLFCFNHGCFPANRT